MSDPVAFHGKSELKALAIRRVEKYRDARSINPLLHIDWLPEHAMCSVIGALLESKDVESFEALTGISKPLADLVQCVLGVSAVSVPNAVFATSLHTAPPQYVLPDAMASHWTAWLEAIPVGAVMPDLFAPFAAWVLRDLPRDDHAAAPLPVELRVLIARVADLFESVAAGQAVGADDWKGVRKSCVAFTDAADSSAFGNEFVKPIAQFLEAVCWSWDGDYTEPLQSLRSLGLQMTELLATRMRSAADDEVIAGQQRAMAQWMRESKTDAGFDARSFFANSAEMTRYWGLQFQQVLAHHKMAVTPLVGGRMLAGLLDLIKKSQSTPG